MASFQDFAIITYSLGFFTFMLVLLGYNFRSKLRALWVSLRKPLLKYLSYQPAVHSRRSNIQWSRGDVLAEVAYLGINIFWVYFRSPSLAAASRRAANLCVGSLAFLFVTPHLDALTNTLGLRCRTVRRFHGSVGIMAASLLVFHVVASAVSETPFAVTKADDKWTVLAAVFIGVSIAISLPFLRNRWYETFLHVHQCLAIASLYGIWVHITPRRLLSRLHLYALVGGASLCTAVLGFITFWRNGIFRYRLPRADISHSHGALLVTVHLARPIQVKAGQYISLWLFIPSTSFHALFETHPFMVASWSDAPLYTLDLVIEPRMGLTRQLLQRSQTRQDPCLALLSGPHGNSIPVGNYEVVLMVASGYGIAAQLPYLKQLLHEYNSRKVRTRRIRLVWELKTLDLARAVEILLNNALNDDTLDNGYILQVSVYVEQNATAREISPRAQVIRGLPDWASIIRDEVAGKDIKRVQDEASTRGELIVTVAASRSVRRDLQAIVQRHVDDGVELMELDYQPA